MSGGLISIVKYPVSFLAKKIKGRSSRVLRQAFHELKNGVNVVYGRQVAIMEVRTWLGNC